MSKPITDAQWRYLKLALEDDRADDAKYLLRKYGGDPLALTRQEAFWVIKQLESDYNPDAVEYQEPRPSNVYEPEPQVLYRMYNADNVLLYVGVSKNALARMDQHEAAKPWFTEVALVKFEHHANRESVLEAERLAILTEQPRHNQQHSGNTIDNHLTQIPMLDDHAGLYRMIKHDMENRWQNQGAFIWGSSWVSQSFLYSVGVNYGFIKSVDSFSCPLCEKILDSKRWLNADDAFMDFCLKKSHNEPR